MTTDWVLAGGYQGFPLMYHWRVLPGTAPLPEELAGVDRAVAHWGGGPGIRRRIEGIAGASAFLDLFLEYVPQTLDAWLAERLAAGEDEADRACSLAAAGLDAGTSFLNARGVLHFDAHFRNVLVADDRLCFADYGLAVSSRFDLSGAETDFFGQHRSYDRCLTRSWLVNRLITGVYGYGREEREALLHACARGAAPPDGPPAAREIISRHAPLAAVMTEFHGRLQDGDRTAPYPAEALHRALVADGSRHG
ncbi:protein kinase family protein [Streptomyces spiramenti]|uniref:protein kinase family protein n=1 Tax=Streptomyces spiramenti TaxID=2720606 RepID=UPI003B831D43